VKLKQHLDDLAQEAMREALDTNEDAPALLRRATDAKFGDFQLNGAMPLSKRLGKPPKEIAGPLAFQMADDPSVWSAEVAGPGFVNLRIADDWLADRLTEDLRDTSRDGVPTVKVPEKIVVDYSAPNIAKRMHVGHLRSTIIGDAIKRLLRFSGHEVVGDNHIGDWGTQFGLLIVGMRSFGSERALDDAPMEELERVYKLASDKAKEDEDFASRAREELVKLQRGDEENTELWKRFVKATRTSLSHVYGRLGVEFDEWLGESFYHDMLPGVVKRLQEAGIAREDQGAICVFWEELADAPKELRKQKEPFIIRKKDGAFLYSTTDIATLIYRQEKMASDRAIYVVDTRQALHFKQLFAVAKRLGIDLTPQHVGFGSVLGADGKPLKTREGGVITLESLLDEAEQRAADRIREEGLDIDEAAIPDVARAVGIGAVKYADLRQNRMSDYRFDWDKLISFKGNAGPYLQYAYARIGSIFRKGEIDPSDIHASSRIVLSHEAESALARQLMHFGDVVHEAAESYEPHVLCDHLFSLARVFSTFYEACPVLKAEGETRQSRLGLAALTARQIKRGLGLLGIEVVHRM
jgi:arginyl-tRNA synthetase